MDNSAALFFLKSFCSALSLDSPVVRPSFRALVRFSCGGVVGAWIDCANLRSSYPPECF